MFKFIKRFSRPFRIIVKRFYINKIYIKKLTSVTLRSNMRHEAHRIEKSYYNKVYKTDFSPDVNKSKSILAMRDLLVAKEGFSQINMPPDSAWSCFIANNFDHLDTSFIDSKKTKKKFQINSDNFYNLMEERRSVRSWKVKDSDFQVYDSLARRLIGLAINMPSSGNRQAVRFLPLIKLKDRAFLQDLKEPHCYNAPLIILVFSETCVYGSYGSFGKNEQCMLIDASAAASAILIGAEVEGYSTSWNHFGMDLINSRKKNRSAYKKLVDEFNISKTLAPVAAISIGEELFQPPAPLRMPLEDFIIGN